MYNGTEKFAVPQIFGGLNTYKLISAHLKFRTPACSGGGKGRVDLISATAGLRARAMCGAGLEWGIIPQVWQPPQLLWQFLALLQ